MTVQSVTVQARLLAIGDLWLGERVTDVANLPGSYPQGILAVTLVNDDTGATRTANFPPDRWLQVMRGT
jgi:hypothetical protein